MVKPQERTFTEREVVEIGKSLVHLAMAHGLRNLAYLERYATIIPYRPEMDSKRGFRVVETVQDRVERTLRGEGVTDEQRKSMAEAALEDIRRHYDPLPEPLKEELGRIAPFELKPAVIEDYKKYLNGILGNQ